MFQESCQHRPAPKYPQYTMYKFLSCNITKCRDYIVQHCYIVKIYNILLFVFEESCQPGPALKRSPTIFFSLFIFQSIIMLNPFTFSNRFNSPNIILVKYCDRHLIDFVAFVFHTQFLVSIAMFKISQKIYKNSEELKYSDIACLGNINLP